jgi:hypothetical protein
MRIDSNLIIKIIDERIEELSRREYTERVHNLNPSGALTITAAEIELRNLKRTIEELTDGG